MTTYLIPTETHPNLPAGSGYSPVIAHLVNGYRRWEADSWLIIESATVYTRGPIDRSMTVEHDNGRTELFSRDGRWSDSLGLDATAEADSWLDHMWQEATGHRD